MKDGVLWRAVKGNAVAGFVSEAYWAGYQQARLPTEFWPDKVDHERAHRVVLFAPILRRYVGGRFLGEALRRLTDAGWDVRAQ